MSYAPYLATEGCRQLSMPYPVGVACIFCQGHGAMPLGFDPSGSFTVPPRCGHCNGTGKK